MPMRLAILNITGGGLSGGYSKYLDNIVPRLLKKEGVSSLLVAAPPHDALVGWQRKYPTVTWVVLKRHVWPFWTIGDEEKRCIIRFSPDVVFIPTARSWRIKNVPMVNMVRNMEPFVRFADDGSLIKKMKLFLQRRVTQRAVFGADRTIAVSNYVKDFLVLNWRVSPEKIGRVYHGCGDEAGVLPARKPSSYPKNIREGDFLFTAGSICPYRGLEDIIAALGYLRERDISVPDTLIAGKMLFLAGPYRKRLQRLICDKKVSDKVHWLGELSQDEMRWCYENCGSFLMTSRVEACPNIALEAMAHGCVCVSTNNPPMPEFFGNAAVYYDADDARGLSQAIFSVLGWNQNKKDEMSRRAMERVRTLSWDNTIDDLMKELRLALEFQKGKC